MAAVSLLAKPHDHGRTAASGGMLSTRFLTCRWPFSLFSPEIQNSYLVLVLFRPAALTDAGCAVELVRLCDILTFLVVLRILFFSFPWWREVLGCSQQGKAAVGEDVFVLRELPCAAAFCKKLLPLECHRWAFCPPVQFCLLINEFLYLNF